MAAKKRKKKGIVSEGGRNIKKGRQKRRKSVSKNKTNRASSIRSAKTNMYTGKEN